MTFVSRQRESVAKLDQKRSQGAIDIVSYRSWQVTDFDQTALRIIQVLDTTVRVTSEFILFCVNNVTERDFIYLFSR